MSHPAHIDRFRVVRLIGSGGMGHVYEAVDPEIQRRVALKVLRRDLLSDNPELLQRLFVEARAANAIGHPGVVQISEAKLLPEGSGYLVMELLEGVTLTQRLRRAGGRLQLAEALPLAIQVASALRAGHQRGIVHRDLKPDNIMLVADDAVASGERVKLLDFGIAKLVHDAASDAPLTLADMGLGTPGYMAPEQIRGAADASARCDVYGLGAVLFEMLSGRRPHVAGNTADLVVQALSVDAPHIDTLVTGLPRSLDPLLAQMLLREPAEARPDMSEVLRRLSLVVAESGEVPSLGAPVLTLASGPVAVSAAASLPSLEPLGDVAPAALPRKEQGFAASAVAQSTAAPAVSSPSTDSQLIGQRPSAAATPQPNRSMRWQLVGSALAVSAVALVVMLWRHNHQPPPLGVPPVSGAIANGEVSPPTPNRGPDREGTKSAERLQPRPSTPPDGPTSVPPLESPNKQPGHPACVERSPTKILPADATLIAAVKDSIRTYNLRLCKNEKVVLVLNPGDSSMFIKKIPARLKNNPSFDGFSFTNRIQGTLATGNAPRLQYKEITISN